MLKLSDRKWKEFFLIDLFSIFLSKGDNQAKSLKDGCVPLVSAGAINNGICKYILTGDGISELFDKNTITVDMFGKVFFQPAVFFAVSHGRVNILMPKVQINKQIGLFLAQALEKRFLNKYSFANMCNQRRLQRERLLLPIDSNEKPDYEFMEQYIKQIINTKRDEYRRFLNKQT